MAMVGRPCLGSHCVHGTGVERTFVEFVKFSFAHTVLDKLNIGRVLHFVVLVTEVFEAGLLVTGVLDTGVIEAEVLERGVLVAGVLETGVLVTGVMMAGVLKAGVLETGVLET